MSEELVKHIAARLDELGRRVDRIELATSKPEPPKRPWYKPRTPTELIAVIGIPAAFVAAIYTFYDGVWLKLQRLDAATISAAQDKLEELQDLRGEIFVLQSRGEDAEIAAVIEARQARRDRLVQESFVYWQQQPAYFTKKESILLAEELQLAFRQADALEVLADVEGTTTIEKSDIARFKGSLYGAEGPAQDLDRSREHFKAAIGHAEAQNSEMGKKQLWAKVTFHWLYTELANQSDCEPVKPVAGLLSDLMAEDPEGAYLASLDADARKLLVVFEDRCGPLPSDG